MKGNNETQFFFQTLETHQEFQKLKNITRTRRQRCYIEDRAGWKCHGNVTEKARGGKNILN